MKAWSMWVLLDERGKAWCYQGTRTPVLSVRRKQALDLVQRLTDRRGKKYRAVRATVTVTSSQGEK